MRLKDIIVEDFSNYKKPSIFLITIGCDWKCCREAGVDPSICQNEPIVKQPTKTFDDEYIYNVFSSNPITDSVVVGGLEPFLQFDELCDLISTFRNKGEKCDFVVYTGYYPEEIQNELAALSHYPNIIVKFGRFIPNRAPVFDNVLGVTLISDNQYAKRIS